MKKKQRISDLFYDNRFLLVFSLIVAVLFWLIVAVELGVEVENTIKNVPVTVNYERVEADLGLKPFGEKTFTVDVTVSGKKYVVEDNEIIDDIVVEANTSYVNSAGTSVLNLDVSSKNARPLYDIIDISSDEISVYFDYPGEKEVVAIPQIEFEGDPVSEGYYMDDFIFPESNKIKVTGPETEINKISQVIAKASVEGQLRQNITVDAELTALTANGDTVRNISFNRQAEFIRITIPVYKIAELPLSCGFVNIPSNYVENPPYTITVRPAVAKVGVPEKKLDGISSLGILTIDFSQLKEGVNTFTVKADSITNAVIIDEIDEFAVTVTVDGMSSRTVLAPSTVNFTNIPDGKNAELVKLDFSEITVVGPELSLNELKSDNMTLTADLSDVSAETKGNVTVPVMLTDDDCWSYGEYTATITII